MHLAQCKDCSAECDQIRFGMVMVLHLPRFEAPDALWESIERAFQENQTHAATPLFRRWRFALAAAMLVVLAASVYWGIGHRVGTRWEVVRLNGAPTMGTIGAGEWIETDSRSRATVKIGAIGTVEIAPNTRVRILKTRPDDHRIALVRGEIRAQISAPPKLFFVDTASGTAVDLGCEYSLNTDEDGSGVLRVTKGWVGFQWNGLESLVPAGASCRTRPHLGPGIPYFDDASDNLKQAAETFGFEKGGDESLNVILSESRVRDTLTLWHLLARVDIEDRARVFDRIAALTPVPVGISRDQALKLDRETLRHWKDELAWTW